MTNSTSSLIVKLLIILVLPLLILWKQNILFNQLDSLEKSKIILNSDKEILPSVCNFIKRSLEARIWGSPRWWKHIKHNIVFIKQWQLYLFIYIVCLMLVYVCIAIPKRVLYAIKIIIFRTLFRVLLRQV